MKKLCIGLGLFVSLQAVALAMEQGMEQKKQENFQAKKQEALKQMDAQITLLQQARECMNAANDWDAMKKCHEDKEQAMKRMWQENRQMEIKRIEEQQQKLEERKRQLQQKENEPRQGNK